MGMALERCGEGGMTNKLRADKVSKNLFFCSDLITALQPAPLKLNDSSAHRGSKARGWQRPVISCRSLGGCCDKHL